MFVTGDDDCKGDWDVIPGSEDEIEALLNGWPLTLPPLPRYIPSKQTKPNQSGTGPNTLPLGSRCPTLAQDDTKQSINSWNTYVPRQIIHLDKYTGRPLHGAINDANRNIQYAVDTAAVQVAGLNRNLFRDLLEMDIAVWSTFRPCGLITSWNRYEGAEDRRRRFMTDKVFYQVGYINEESARRALNLSNTSIWAAWKEKRITLTVRPRTFYISWIQHDIANGPYTPTVPSSLTIPKHLTSLEVQSDPSLQMAPAIELDERFDGSPITHHSRFDGSIDKKANKENSDMQKAYHSHQGRNHNHHYQKRATPDGQPEIFRKKIKLYERTRIYI